MPSFSDSFFAPKGELEIRIWRGPVGDFNDATDRKRVEEIVRSNLVVTIGRRIMSRLLSGASGSPTITTVGGGPITITAFSEIIIDSMKWGTAGHDPGDPTMAIAPQPSDEGLNTPLITPASKTVTVTYPTDLTVEFSASLDQSEANGLAISEEGLFTDPAIHDLLFARTTFGQLNKTVDFAFEFAHRIVF